MATTEQEAVQTANRSESSGANGEGRRRGLISVAIVGILIVAGALGFWLYSRTYESTDDAQVAGHLNGITARIDGTIRAVYVEENQTVHTDQLVADMDPRDYAVAFEQAQAQLLKAQADLRAQDPNVNVTEATARTDISTSGSEVGNAEAAEAAAERDYVAAQARLREAETNNAKAQANVMRYQALVEKGEVARAQYDQVVATA